MLRAQNHRPLRRGDVSPGPALLHVKGKTRFDIKDGGPCPCRVASYMIQGCLQGSPPVFLSQQGHTKVRGI